MRRAKRQAVPPAPTPPHSTARPTPTPTRAWGNNGMDASRPRRPDRARELEATHARATSDERRATRPRERRGNGTNERGEKTAMRCARAMTTTRRRTRSTRARARSIIDLGRGGALFLCHSRSIGRRRRRRRSRAGKSCTFRLDSVGIKSGPSFGRCEDDEDGGGNARGRRSESSPRARVNEAGGEDARGMTDDRS